jgi:hypothetical protein
MNGVTAARLLLSGKLPVKAIDMPLDIIVLTATHI